MANTTSLSSSSTSTSSSVWKSLSFLLFGLAFAQWLLVLSLLRAQYPSQQVGSQPQDGTIQDYLSPVNDVALSRNMKSMNTATGSINSKKDGPVYDGVAVTLMLRAPKWFHRRYTVMLHNALANIPQSWPVQVFSNEEWLAQDVLPLHPGLRLLRSNPRIIWTPLPTELSRRQTKPKEVMKSTWLWDQVVAENVLLFSGNGAFCGNTKTSIEEFLQYDYVGVPWGQFHGKAGDGSTHSFRHRSAMIQVLKDHPPEPEMDQTDHNFFVKHMLETGNDNNNKNGRFRVGDKATTYAFGGISDRESSPFVVSGTQASLNWTSRDALLTVCPELKIIFPSLHDPACFGAHPNGEKCKASICALQDTIPSHGC